MKHPRVRAIMAQSKEHLAFKVASDTKKTKMVPKHTLFQDHQSALTANWADVVNGLLPKAKAYLAMTDPTLEINPDRASRKLPLWTLATIKGLWVGCVGGRTSATTRISMNVALPGSEGEYLSFRGFFCIIKMPSDVILIANDILAPLKVQLMVLGVPLPLFAMTLNNPDILIPGSITPNFKTKHMHGKNISTARGPMIKDVPPSSKSKRVTVNPTTPTFLTTEIPPETDYATYRATSLMAEEASEIFKEHQISHNKTARAPVAFEELLLLDVFDVELSCTKPVIWMLVQILCRYHLAFLYKDHVIGHYDKLPYSPTFVGAPPPCTKPRTHSPADKDVLQAEVDSMMQIGRW
ncbi:hypothetical protein HDU86_001667 [Geranomyces michiganensis]|nr:hypothetical protein HDU86_001667 [Geranomyces michiganensis]